MGVYIKKKKSCGSRQDDSYIYGVNNYGDETREEDVATETSDATT